MWPLLLKIPVFSLHIIDVKLLKRRQLLTKCDVTVEMPRIPHSHAETIIKILLISVDWTRVWGTYSLFWQILDLGLGTAGSLMLQHFVTWVQFYYILLLYFVAFFSLFWLFIASHFWWTQFPYLSLPDHLNYDLFCRWVIMRAVVEDMKNHWAHISISW